MKAFLARDMAPKSLAAKNVPQRVERYRELKEKYGKLQFASVVKEAPEELTVKLMDADATVREFIFAVQTEAPYKLISVSIREQGGHGFGGFHH